LDSTGLDQYTNPGVRDECLSVDLESQITALNTPLGVWVNAFPPRTVFPLRFTMRQQVTFNWRRRKATEVRL
ncbi:hypothetical protein N9L86_05700, partial [Euryarchaeota archaeon]|nr:hypothetical protein [Euryarchaeota archaeon]